MRCGPLWLLIALSCPAWSLDVAWDTAILRLDDRGAVTGLIDRATGRDVAVPGGPLCRVQTGGGLLAPERVSQDGERLTFGFPGGLALVWRVRTGPGYSWWELDELRGVEPDQVQMIRLANLAVDGLPTVGTVMGAAYDDQFAVAVFGTHPNVHAAGRPPASNGGNLAGVTHTFAPAPERAKQGRQGALFAATSTRPTNDGWSYRPRPLSPTLDLTGLRAIRLWVLGDGKGEQLKVQLSDGQGGYRDDYIPITFTGWREVTCDQPQLNTINLSRVATLGFYYNGLPANSQVECVLDDVRAVVDEGRIAPLEDFEDPASDLWDNRGAILRAEVLAKYGLTPAGFGIVASPRARFTEAIAGFEQAAGLPSPRPGGAWGKTSPAQQRSYLFITRFGEQDTAQVIDWAHRGGFATVLICDGSWNRTCGHHEISPAFFPTGLPSLQSTADRLHQAGLKVGLHYLAAAVYGNDAYVTPKPDDRLVIDASGQLAAGIDAAATFIPMGQPPTGFPATDEGYTGNGTVVRIGDELIAYSALKLTPPYGLDGCRRGHHGTAAAVHSAGDAVRHLQRSYGYYLFDLDTDLADEVAANVARTADAIGADMLYWDGSERLQGEHWYYNAKLQDLYYHHVKNKDMLFQGSSYSPWSWHIVSRTASADGHGDVKGYLDERIPRFAWYRDNLMPLDCGWYYVYDPEVTVDQYDYILQKCLAFDASISVQTSPRQLADHPEIGPIFDLCGIYERLRLSGLVSAETKRLLAEPKREYRMLRQPLRLRRTTFGPWREVPAAEAAAVALEVEPALPGARLGIQVRCGNLTRPGAAYTSPDAVVLEDFRTLAPYIGQPDNPADVLVVGTDKAGTTSAGVTQQWAIESQGFEDGPCAVFTASSTRPDAAGWAAFGKRFPTDLDMSSHVGIGLWLQGDGQGGKFKLQLRDEAGATDYYLDNSFTGWRYFQLRRPAGPSPLPMDYRRVRYLMFYYNGMPAGKTLTCRIAGVKALQTLDEGRLVDPTLTIGERTIRFPVTLTQGERLVWFAGEAPYVIPATQGERRALPPVETVTLSLAIPATLSFAEPPGADLKVRVVQDNAEELPLPENALATELPPLR